MEFLNLSRQVRVLILHWDREAIVDTRIDQLVHRLEHTLQHHYRFSVKVLEPETSEDKFQNNQLYLADVILDETGNMSNRRPLKTPEGGNTRIFHSNKAMDKNDIFILI
ncbi:hypothetical protein PG984_007062 [Apiospora sp. TS-2023a]